MPPTAASRKAAKVMLSVTSSDCSSKPASEISVPNTSHGPGSTKGGIANAVTTSCQSTRPSRQHRDGQSDAQRPGTDFHVGHHGALSAMARASASDTSRQNTV